MTGEEKINIKIKKDMGITQALKKLVKDAGESVKGSVWNATLEKLVELNNKRKADKQNSIFSGGTECNDWHHNYVVHEGEIEFSKSEMEVLLDAMEVSEGVKSKILGNVPEVVDPPEVAEPPAGGGGVEPPVEGAVKTPAEIEQVAKEKGYRKTDHEGTYFDDKTQTHYRWDDETGDFKALENVKQIYADGTYRGKDNKFYGADDNPFTGERVTKNEDETVITTETYKDGVYDGKSVVTINEDKSYKKETYDKDNKLIKTENYNAEGKLTSSVVGNRTTTVEYTDNGSVWTEKEGKNVMKVTKRDSDGRTIEVAEGNAVLTYSYNEDGSYTVTKKVDGKLNQITDYNSEGLEVRWQKYNEEEVLDRESKYTYRQDGTRIADIEYYNVTLERDLISEQVIELKLKQDDAWYMVSHIAKQKDGKYNVNVDMNMYLGSTVVGDQCIVYIETEEEAKALQEELLGLRELYSEIAYYDKDGVQRAEPEISDERKTEIITKLTETISDKDKPLEVRQAAAFAATYGCLMDDETLQNAIIDTNDPAIINRLEGHDLQPEQWEKIYNMALKPEFRDSYGYDDVYRMLIGDEGSAYNLNTPDEIKFKAFNNLPRSWDKDGGAYYAIPKLPVDFLNEHVEEIKPEDKFYLYARSENEMDKETFDTNFIPSIPANSTADQVDIIKDTMNRLPEEVRGDYHLIESGDRFYNIIMDKIFDDPSIIEALGKKTDWDYARKKEAINEYIKDFGDDIAKQLGIDDPSKIQPGQIFDFSKVEWPQPDYLNWLFNY